MNSVRLIGGGGGGEEGFPYAALPPGDLDPGVSETKGNPSNVSSALWLWLGFGGLDEIKFRDGRWTIAGDLQKGDDDNPYNQSLSPDASELVLPMAGAREALNKGVDQAGNTFLEDDNDKPYNHPIRLALLLIGTPVTTFAIQALVSDTTMDAGVCVFFYGVVKSFFIVRPLHGWFVKTNVDPDEPVNAELNTSCGGEWFDAHQPILPHLFLGLSLIPVAFLLSIESPYGEALGGIDFMIELGLAWLWCDKSGWSDTHLAINANLFYLRIGMLVAAILFVLCDDFLSRDFGELLDRFILGYVLNGLMGLCAASIDQGFFIPQVEEVTDVTQRRDDDIESGLPGDVAETVNSGGSSTGTQHNPVDDRGRYAGFALGVNIFCTGLASVVYHECQGSLWFYLLALPVSAGVNALAYDGLTQGPLTESVFSACAGFVTDYGIGGSSQDRGSAPLPPAAGGDGASGLTDPLLKGVEGGRV
jgi:hypothetical protein